MTMLGRVRGSTTAARSGRPRRLAAVLGATVAATALVTAVTVPVAGPAGAVVWTTPCTATVHVDSSWGGTETWAGAVLTVTVTNPATTATTTWSATSRLADGQSVGALWNARYAEAGVSLVASNDVANGALVPGASTTFGVYLRGGSQIPSFSCLSDAPRPIRNTTVGEADNGKAVTLVKGDTLTVELGQDWQPPTLEGDALELVSVTGGYPTGLPLKAVYRAQWGSSTPTILRSRTDADCLHTPPLCARPIRLWSVSVRVAVPPPAV